MKKITDLLFLLGLFLVVILSGNSFVFAQKSTDWSPQQHIPGYENETWPPILIADRNRTIHAFSSQWIDGDEGRKVRAIMYNRWTLDRGWTPPNDILLPPFKNDARVLDVLLDQSGNVKIIFFGGDNTEANIYYSSAPIAEAGNAQSWSSPIIVEAEPIEDPGAAALFAEDSQRLVMVFGGKKAGNGLYATYSADSGNTWSDPELIFATYNDQLYPYYIHVYMGNFGLLHTAWDIWDPSGNGISVYYANYDVAKKKWSIPLQLSSKGRSGFSNVIEYDGRVIVNYIDYDTNAFFMRESSDNGHTWTNPVRIAPHHIGRNGGCAFSIDNNNTLHFFFAERITGTAGNPDIHGMWHTILQNHDWIEPEPVVSGPRVEDRVGDKGFDPLEARAVVSQGNLIMITWRTETQSKGNGVWYSYMKVNAPELSIEALPSQSVQINDTSAIAAITPTHGTTPEPDPAFNQIEDFRTMPQNNPADRNGSISSLIAGLVPLAILIPIAVIYILYKRRQL